MVERPGYCGCLSCYSNSNADVRSCLFVLCSIRVEETSQLRTRGQEDEGEERAHQLALSFGNSAAVQSNPIHHRWFSHTVKRTKSSLFSFPSLSSSFPPALPAPKRTPLLVLLIADFPLRVQNVANLTSGGVNGARRVRMARPRRRSEMCGGRRKTRASASTRVLAFHARGGRMGDVGVQKSSSSSLSFWSVTSFFTTRSGSWIASPSPSPLRRNSHTPAPTLATIPILPERHTRTHPVVTLSAANLLPCFQLSIWRKLSTSARKGSKARRDSSGGGVERTMELGEWDVDEEGLVDWEGEREAALAGGGDMMCRKGVVSGDSNAASLMFVAAGLGAGEGYSYACAGVVAHFQDSPDSFDKYQWYS
ncbi:hypothetical protein BT69DRAFT_933632 [Atractiella rhizophila]|nr:hypothetical protein BT69DRAFT_933632 [Atractiella rhizophila]